MSVMIGIPTDGLIQVIEDEVTRYDEINGKPYKKKIGIKSIMIGQKEISDDEYLDPIRDGESVAYFWSESSFDAIGLEASFIDYKSQGEEVYERNEPTLIGLSVPNGATAKDVTQIFSNVKQKLTEMGIDKEPRLYMWSDYDY